MASHEEALAVQLQAPTGSWVDVGYLRQKDARNWFEFVESYWELASRPVLGQIYEEEGRAWQSYTHVALPRWFSHLLPEGRLREAVARTANISSKREFELIKRLGASDLPGAVRVVDVGAGVPSTSAPPVAEEIGSDEDDPLLKFSLAGAQLKFSVFGDERGLTVPTSGRAGNFILKFPDGRVGFEEVPEAEFAALELARSIGIDTPSARLVDPREVKGLREWASLANGPALAVERFDRKQDDLRVHMEELAQVLNIPAAREKAKYKGANFETVAVFAAALAGTASVGEVIDRIVLNVLLGNGDAHLKNWAFLYKDGRRPSLSPVYDILPTALFIPNDDLGLNLRKNKKFEDVSLSSFEVLGERSSFGKRQAYERAELAVEKVMGNWGVLEDTLSGEKVARLTKRLNSLELVNNRKAS